MRDCPRAAQYRAQGGHDHRLRLTPITTTRVWRHVTSDARISVVTITWNNLAGLQSTVNSVDQQVQLPHEHIVIDGASEDGTSDWLADAAGAAFRSVVSEPDDGIYDAMNKGLRRSAGDYVIFLNAGDRFASAETLQTIGRVIDASDPAWGFGQSRVEFDGWTGVHALRRPRAPRFFGGLATVPHQATFMRRDLLAALGGFRTGVGISADQELIMRAWLRASPVGLSEVLAICDGSGVGSTQSAGAWSRQAAEHRRRAAVPIAGMVGANQVIMTAGVVYDVLRRFAKPGLSRNGRSGGPK